MPNIKNFGQKGIADDVQYGKRGGRVKFDSSVIDFFFRNSDDTFYAQVHGGDPTEDTHFVTKGHFDRNAGQFYGNKVQQTDGAQMFSKIKKFTFNRSDGFYLTQGSEPDEVIINFGAPSTSVDLIDIDETPGATPSFADVTRLRFNTNTGFYLTTDSMGNPVVNFIDVATQEELDVVDDRLTALEARRFYLNVGQTDDTPTFKDINTIKFNRDQFYVNQNSPNTDEVQVNLRIDVDRAADARFRRADIGTGATQNIGAVLPSGAIVNRIKLVVTEAYNNANTEIVIQSDGSQTYMSGDENDPQETDITFIAEQSPSQSPIDGTGQVQATVSNSPTAGVATVLVEYLLD